METYKEIIISEELQEIVWNNTGYCVYSERSPYFGMKKAPGCSPNKPCRGGNSQVVLGKEIEHICSFGKGFLNPDETILKGIKKLLIWEKQTRDEEHNNNKSTW